VNLIGTGLIQLTDGTGQTNLTNNPVDDRLRNVVGVP
jgi:hypothetical protein